MNIKILITIVIAKLCSASELYVENQNLKIERENLQWLVAIFHVPKGISPTDDLMYEYLCPAVMIHPRAALALSYCWSKPSLTLDAVVRSYNWKNDIISAETPYQERYVADILNFVSYNTQQSVASHINIVVLHSQFSMVPETNIVPYDNYNKRRQLHRNECYSIQITGNITQGLSVKKIPIWPSEKVSCCLNWMSSEATLNDPAGHLNKCIDKLNDLDCFEYMDSYSCDNLDSLGSPVLCPSDDTSIGLYYLRGLVSYRQKCKFVVSDIEKKKEWIGGELDFLYY